MQNLPIPASAMPPPANPAVNAVPGVTEIPSGRIADADGFGAILMQHVAGKTGGLKPDAALPAAASDQSQPQQPDGGLAALQIPSDLSPVAPSLLAQISGIPPAQPDKPISGDPRLVPAKALATVLPTEISAPHDFPQSAVAGRPPFESDNTAADFAAPGRFLPPVAAENRKPHSVGGELVTQKMVTQHFPDVTPLPQMTHPAIAAAALAPAAAPAAHNLKLDVQVGAPGWSSELAHKVVWMTSQQQQVAELHLNPPHLGPVEVMLTIGNDQAAQASAQFSSPHSAVREAIEAALPRLREMMADNGISLGNVTVSADSFQQQAEARRQDWPSVKQAGDAPQTAAGLAARSTTSLVRSAHNGLVDTFA